MSLPPRECGLKFFVVLIDPLHLLVAPSAGAWIEITTSLILMSARIVAPSAGAWIEIDANGVCCDAGRVAPSAGAWIEMSVSGSFVSSSRSRSLRGSVD